MAGKMPAPANSTRDVEMLAIISDLHITDGTTGELLPPGTMDLLCDRLCDLAWRASWRSDGRYCPIDRIDLILSFHETMTFVRIEVRVD